MTSKDKNIILNEALKYHHEGKLAEADNLYLKVLSLDKNDFNANHLHGCILSQRNDYEDAIKFITRAVEIIPSNYEANNNLGIAYKNLKDKANAEKYFHKAIDIDQKNYKSYFNCANLYSDVNQFDKSIEFLKGVGPERARLLNEELNIKTFQDLLHFFPNRYIDRSQFHSINKLPQNNSEVQIKGKIISIEYVSQKRGKRMIAKFEDETGVMELVWFRGLKWIRDSLKLNQDYVIFGRLNWFGGRANMAHPEMDLEINFQNKLRADFYPIYPSTEKLINKGISQRVIQKLMLSLIHI